MKRPLSELTSIELTRFYDQVAQSFKVLFCELQVKEEILQIIKFIEENQPIAGLLEPEEKGSFWTIFLPFHSNTEIFFKFQKNLNKNLVKFCKLSGQIECLLTETSDVFYIQEPPIELKENLLFLLKKFIKILPDFDTFKSWLREES